MIPLNFPEYSFRIRQTPKRREIFDKIRKKFVALTPEEWVRQHVVRFLIEEKGVPSGRMNVEVSITVLNNVRRADVVIFDDLGAPVMVVECKAPQVKITQDSFDQIARYNIPLKTRYLMVTNGLTHFYCYIDFENQTYRFLEYLPDYRDFILR